MQVTETSAEGLKREFTVVVGQDEIDRRVDDRLEALRHSVRIPGFRPGKVPVSLLRKRFGEAIRGEILEQAVAETSSQTFAERGVRPAIEPRIELVRSAAGEDLEYTMAVELLPEIVPADFSKFALVRYRPEITDAQVDEALERQGAREKSYAPVTEDRPAERGDALVIDFVGTLDGEPFPGGSASDHILELGASEFVEGFEDQLIGARPGDHREVRITFPEGYGNAELAGRDAVFEVDVKEIQTVERTAVDDAFAQSHGFADLAAMREAVREQLVREYGSVARGRLKRELLDRLAEAHDFAIPEGMLESEFEAIWQRVEEARANDQLDPDDVGRSDDELRADYRKIAERRVRLGLLLAEIGRLNNITVEAEELQRAVLERTRAFPGNEQAVLSFYRENPAALAELRAPLFEDKVIDFILELADVTDEKVSVETLLAEGEAQSEAQSEEKSEAPA